MDNKYFTVRFTQWSDLEAVTTLIREVLTADGDAISAVTSAELAREWRSEGFTLARDAWVATTDDGREEFDPTLWHIAWDGDQIAGHAQTRYRNGIGRVGNLAVRVPGGSAVWVKHCCCTRSTSSISAA